MRRQRVARLNFVADAYADLRLCPGDAWFAEHLSFRVYGHWGPCPPVGDGSGTASTPALLAALAPSAQDLATALQGRETDPEAEAEAVERRGVRNTT